MNPYAVPLTAAAPYASGSNVDQPLLGSTTGSIAACVNPVYVNQANGPLNPQFGAGPYVTYPNRFRAVCQQMRGGRAYLEIHQVMDFTPSLHRNIRPTLPQNAADGSGLQASAWTLLAGNLAAVAKSATLG